MADVSLSRKIEFTLTVALLTGAGLSFTVWHEPGCGVISVYLAIRLALIGIVVVERES
jgi:hypothetical protein